ncbi:hypothetical protein FSARC_6400 [Fusarium sarcochroum]|uniref:DRPLA protein n=1 Tax=Fusarium sarcochroum TaxID=1208366 RepID=A0A8H4X9D9_9HYPO|nr:hypothetical protein FSARC_6400 [Fusarium sarcochroum]
MSSDVVQELPANKRKMWTPEENTLIIELQSKRMPWKDVAKHLPGRTPLGCRQHYNVYLAKEDAVEEEHKAKLAKLYESSREEMWTPIAKNMGVPWQAAEDMHWQLGKTYMDQRRAGVVPFSLDIINIDGNKNDRCSSSRSVSPQLHDGILQDPGAPSAPTVFSNPTLSPQSGLLQVSPPLSGDHYPPPIRIGSDPEPATTSNCWYAPRGR